MADATPHGANASTEDRLKAAIVETLDDNQLMCVATNRSDGWPQATIVNYLRHGPALYFLVARQSQKFANIVRDPRVSIAVGRPPSGPGPVRGLSIAARAAEVTDPHRIEALNQVIWARPDARRFAPHPSSANVAVFEARPELIAITDYSEPPGQTHLVRVVEDWSVALCDGEATTLGA